MPGSGHWPSSCCACLSGSTGSASHMAPWVRKRTRVELRRFELRTSCMPSAGSTSTAVRLRRSPSRAVHRSAPPSTPVAVLECCTHYNASNPVRRSLEPVPGASPGGVPPAWSATAPLGAALRRPGLRGDYGRRTTDWSPWSSTNNCMRAGADIRVDRRLDRRGHTAASSCPAGTPPTAPTGRQAADGPGLLAANQHCLSGL